MQHAHAAHVDLIRSTDAQNDPVADPGFEVFLGIRFAPPLERFS